MGPAGLAGPAGPPAPLDPDPRAAVADRMVRLGTYGDPAAAPADMWKALVATAKGWTGYTHQWRTIDAATWHPLVMASADSLTDMADAHALGYRTFRVTPIGEVAIKGVEIVCPA